jgi:sulfhydrogenase subunit beta (sulfur reductase)
MTAYVVPMELVNRLLQQWAADYQVFVPAVNLDGKYDFLPWEQGLEVAWEYDLAYNTLKRFLFPPHEDLVRFDMANYTAEPVFAAPKQLLFGVHPYDLKGINQLDQLMESGAPDQNYLRRRENTVICTMEPLRVAETAFWASVGADRVDLGFDLYWTRISPSSFYVEVGSARGEELLTSLGAPPKATLAEREAARRERIRVRALANRQGLRYPWKETPRLLARNWNAPIWRHRSQYCLSCGSCVLVCPTCYCFDVREEVDVDLKAGSRFRRWDGCMLPSFALVAPDHNFRPQAMDRYRHRYFRKGKYIFDKIGELGCVGCGRCVRACTAGIANPKAVFNELWEAEQHES